MKNWEKVKLVNDRNEIVEGIAPIIISASRSTDIPAFYSKWFFNRLKKGYISWINPFNRVMQYVSLRKIKFIVFWTKNPEPILPFLPILDEMGIYYYFQYTLNDYEQENIEPNLPELSKRKNVFISLSKLIGKDKVIWRYDPLILSNDLSIPLLLERVTSVGNDIQDYTNKLVFSFADISCYQKVQKNLTAISSSFREFSNNEMLKFSECLYNINKKWGLELATCAEVLDLEKFGIVHNKCIDDNLIYQIGKSDRELVHWLGYDKRKQYSIFEEPIINTNSILKDKGQRKECGCIISKDIGMYNTCNHLCTYCYANHTNQIVKNNIIKHNENNQSIITNT